MHADRDFERVFQFLVSKNVIGMTVGVKNIFDFDILLFNQSQKIIFLPGRINDNSFTGLGARRQICHYLKRPHRDLF